MSTTHFDIAMDKIRCAVQEYEDDWRKGLENGRKISDNEIAELKQEVERLTKENEKLAHWPDRFSDASDRAYEAQKKRDEALAEVKRLKGENALLDEAVCEEREELFKLRERHAKVAKEHKELLNRSIAMATQRNNALDELNRLKAASQPCKTAGEPTTHEQVRLLSERLDWIEKRLAESGFKL